MFNPANCLLETKSVKSETTKLAQYPIWQFRNSSLLEIKVFLMNFHNFNSSAIFRHRGKAQHFWNDGKVF